MQGKPRIPDNFIYTQQSLATFESCPLKFRKRYIQRLRWPSMPGEIVKKRLALGNDFHLLARRYFSGIDTRLEELTEKQEELQAWYQNLKDNFRLGGQVQYLPEYKLRAITPSMQLEANFDLLTIREGAIELWDWKTQQTDPTKASKGKKHINSLQTMVYLFVLGEESHWIIGKGMDFKRISMIYWQPQPPGVIAQIDYSGELHDEFRQVLQEKVRTIRTYDYETFDKSLYSAHCKHCEYNWLCNGQRIEVEYLEYE